MPQQLTPEQALAIAEAEARRRAGQDSSQEPEQEPTLIDRFESAASQQPVAGGAIGLAEVMAMLATGSLSTLAGAIPAIPVAAQVGNNAANEVLSNFQEKFTFRPRTEAGKRIAGALGRAGEAVDTGVKDFVTTPRLFGGLGLGRASPGVQTAAETALVGGSSLLGLRRGAPGFRKDLATEAQARGYVIDPVATNPTSVSGVVEGAGGVLKTRRQAAIRNQEVTDNMIRRRYGIPEDAPIDEQALATVRAQASEAYESVRGSGSVTADVPYFNELDKVTATFRSSDFELNKRVGQELVQTANNMRQVSRFDAGDAIDHIRTLRSKADQAFNLKDKPVGQAWKALADAQERLLERDLARRFGSDNPFVDNFRTARQSIAETYSVQDAIDGGSVSAVTLGRQLDRGVPLQGDINLIARLGNEFSPVFRRIKDGVAPISPLDVGFGTASFGAGAVTGATTGSVPAAIAASLPGLVTLARPAFRSVALGPVGQRAATRGVLPPIAQQPGVIGTILAEEFLRGEEERPPSVFSQ